MTAFGSVRNIDTIVTGGDRVTRAVLDDARSSSHATLELASGLDEPSTKAIERALASGLQLSTLVNAQASSTVGFAARMTDAGASVMHLSDGATGRPRWQHAKAATMGEAGDRAWIFNLPMSRAATGHVDDFLDIGLRFEGDAARAVRQLHTVANDPVAVRAAAGAAAEHGVLLNDQLAGTMFQTEALDQAIAGAGDVLRIWVKGLDDPRTSRSIAAAADRGVDVRVVARDLAPADAELLERSSAQVRIAPQFDPRMHFNLVKADDVALLGSAFPWTQMSRIGPTTWGLTRDLGVRLEGHAARAVGAAAERSLSWADLAPLEHVRPDMLRRTT